MKKKGILLAGFALLMLTPGFGQSLTETALLFSRIKPGGSARILGMGGAQTSLGGDYSSAFSNPAGLGMFNRSEVTLSVGNLSQNTSSAFLGESSRWGKSNLFIPGVSFVFHSNKERSQGILNGTFAITFNRTNDFHGDFRYRGTNASNSIVDFFIADANGLVPDDMLVDGFYFNTPTGLGYNNFLIEDSTALGGLLDTDYFSIIGTFPDNPNDIRRVDQAEEVRTSGAQTQWSFSYGINLDDKIFLGAGVGFASVRYENRKVFTESNIRFDLDPGFSPLDEIRLEETLRINGTGVNLTLGAIARPIDAIQIGVSYMTPTRYQTTDSYLAVMSTRWNDFDYPGIGILRNVSEQTDEVLSDYVLRTPGRLTLGVTGFVQKWGFVTADAEIVNYRNTRYRSQIQGISFDSDNQRIRELYQQIVNIRLGGEFRLKKFRARAGFAVQPDPFRTEQNGVGRQVTSVSGGLGYRTPRFYLDAAIIHASGQTSYRPYRVNSPDSPLVINDNNQLNIVFTLGFPF